jgi:MYXO-CTERM domain-containing protein
MKTSTQSNFLRTALLAVLACALPALAGPDNVGVGTGRNGNFTVPAANHVVNSYAQVTAPLAPGDTAIVVNTATGFAANDLVLVLQTTGIVPVPPSGGPSPVDVTNDPVGRWEFARLASVAGTTMNLTEPLIYSYAGNVTQVVRVPEYATLNNAGGRTIVPQPWNGSTGGVVAFLVQNAFTNFGQIVATGRGFRGGVTVDDASGTTGCTGLDEPAPQGGQKGEGIADTRYGPTHTGRGRVANGGGGGVCYGSGGGGGGNGGTGGQGGNTDSDVDGNRPVGGQGGAALTFQSLDHLLMGGGGGAGHAFNVVPPLRAGGAGGGIIFIRAGSLVGAGAMIANGSPGGSATGLEAGSGGGAGGTVYLRINGAASCGLLQAQGGVGGNSNVEVGPGGGGGGGRILFQKNGGTCTTTATSVIGVLPGQQPDPGAPGGGPYGATAGANGSVTSLTGPFLLSPPVVVTPANGSVTNDTTPTYSGTLATPFPTGTEIAIFVDGVEIARVTPTGAGAWTFTPTAPLTEGVHSVNAIAINTAQAVQSTVSNTNTFTVDLTPPPPPTVVTPPNGSVISDNTPTYSGTAEPGSTVTVFVDGVSVGTTTADGAGNWTLTPATALADGQHMVRATATDAAGNTSPNSNTNTFTVDTTAPLAPVVLTPANGSTTSDTTPAYSGTAEPNSTVNVIVDGVSVGTTTADGAGNWTLTPAAPLTDGVHTVSATATDAVGNTSPVSNTNTFIVDTTAPAAPVVVTPANGSTTNDTTPAYSGTAEPNSTVTVIVDGVPVGTTTADGAGNWTLTPATALADGPHTVRATATDAAGNTSPSSNTNTFTVDTTAPAAPVVVTPANGSTISDNTPAYSGTAEAGSTVTVIVDGLVVGTTTANAGGAWTFTPAVPLADGPHTVRATSTDAAGNTSPSSNTNTFIVDTTAPAAPVVVTPADGSTTNDNTPAYSGTAEPNSTVNVIVDGIPVGTTTADAAGNWTLTPAAPLIDGPHTVRATATDAAGNTSPNSNTNTFIVDTTAPAAPVVQTPADGSAISDNTPAYSGTAEAGSTVTVIVDGLVVGTTTANAGGAWTFTPAVPLADGPHTVRATSTDAAGNTSPSSNTNTFTVDTTAPAAPVVVTPANGSVTNDTTPAYSGTAEANTTVTVIVDGAPVGTTTADGAGNWTFTPAAPLADGPHTVRATATDAAGNTSPSSNTNTFTVDTAAPAAPVVLTPADGSTTNDNTPAYSGTAEPNSTVTVIVDGVSVGTTTASAAGTWSLTPTGGLASGPHTVRATATDAAGNTSPDSNTNTFIVDADPPATPVVLTPANGSVTSDTTPTYSGTGEAGSTINVIVDGVAVGTTTVDAAGNWSFTPVVPLADGAHAVRATATDSGGNTSPDSNTNNFTVDTTAPAAPAVITPADGSLINDSTPTYSGTAEPNSTVTVIVDGASVGTTTADATGAWSFTPTTALADGSHSVRATSTDAAGNTSPSSNTNTFTLDTAAPAAPVVLTPANGSTTSDTTPAYSGTAEPNSPVTIIVDGTPVGTATADAAGNWSFTPVVPLADGPHSVNATAQDAAGNTSPSSATNTFTVDTMGPAAPVVTTPADGSVTNDSTPAYSGTAEPGSTVTVFVDGVAVGTTTADAAGNWTVTSTTALPEGPHTVNANAEDALGNTSPSSAPNTFTVDTTAPAAPVVTTPANGSSTTDTTPAYSGTAEPGSTVTVFVDGASVGTTTADASGNWSLTQPTALAAGQHTVKATATDAAGNTSADSNTNTFTVAAVTPQTPVVTGPANNSTTDDNTPTFTGTAPPGSTVTILLNGTPVGTTTADANGNWSFTPTTPLADGQYVLTVTATDASGNVSQPSAPVNFTVDTAEEPLPGDKDFLGDGLGCASTAGDPSALTMMGLALLAVLGARRRQQ